MSEKKRTPHEAVCYAAGWPAYCEHCGHKLRRIPQLNSSTSACVNKICIDERKEKEARDLNEEFWDLWNYD